MCTWDPKTACELQFLYTIPSVGDDGEEGETTDNYVREMEIKQKELYQWIEELLKSEEVIQYFEKKLPKIDEEIQCDMSETSFSIQHEETQSEIIKKKYPFTEMAKKKYYLMKKLECLSRLNANENIIKKQNETIEKIKEKIAETKRLLNCHQQERQLDRKNKRIKLFEEVKKFLRNDLAYLSHDSDLVEKVLAYKKLRRIQRKTRRQRRIEIVRKLVREFQRQQRTDYEKNKRYDYKVQPRGFVMEDLEIVGTKLTLFARDSYNELMPNETVVKEKEMEKEEEVNVTKGKKKDKEKKDKKGKEGKKTEKKDKNKKKGKDKKGKKKTEEQEEEPLVDIVQVLKKLELVLAENKELKAIRESLKNQADRKDKINYPYDQSFFYKPRLLEFKNYQKGYNYKKYVKILNCSPFARSFRFLRIIWDQPWDPPILEVQPSARIARLYPGLSLTFQILFNPRDCDYLLSGQICFLTYSWRDVDYKYFVIPFKCTPLSPDVKISAYDIDFGKMPIWRVVNTQGKTIKFENVGTKKCSVSISKIHDPLEIENKWIFPVEEVVAEEEEAEVKKEKKEKKEKKVAAAEKKGKGKDKKKEKKGKDKKQKDKKEKKKDDKKKNKKGKDGKKEDKERKKREAELEQKIYEKLVELYVSPDVSEENLSEKLAESPSKTMTKVVHECVENAFNSFVFDNCCFHLDPKGEKLVTINLKNVDCPGYYFEKFSVRIFEEIYNPSNFLQIETEEICIHGEVTGNFIKINPVTLDYKVCVFDSIYQVNFEIENSANITHNLSVRVPSKLSKYLYTDGININVPSGLSRKVFLRFSPKKEIIYSNNRYYNSSSSLLEFPIQVTMLSKNFLDVPPIIIKAYAILTLPNGLTLHPEDAQCSEVNERKEYVLNIGSCTTKETIFANVEIRNNSLAIQHFGFLDLPESIIISPNYGFGILMPLESKTLTIMYSPESKDIPNYFLEQKICSGDVMVAFSVETVKNKGGIQGSLRAVDTKLSVAHSLKNSLMVLDKELYKADSLRWYHEITSCMHQLSGTFDSLSQNEFVINKEPSFLKSVESARSYKAIGSSNKMWLIMKIFTPLCDLSHQFVRFSDTPCGSYSMVSIDFRNFVEEAFDANCVCGYIKETKKKEKDIKCSIRFEITGDNKEILIEPFCGILKPDEKSRKLFLIAKPNVPPEVVEEQAKAIKRQQVIDRKLKILMEKREIQMQAKLAKEKAKNKNKEKTNKKNKKGNKEIEATQENDELSKLPPLPPIFVKDEEIKINFFDLYPAEMILWRNFEPYEIKSKFVCNCHYQCANIEKKMDTLYIEAVCKVIQPDFTHNLVQQRINFGTVAIGMSIKKVISIQNIQHHPINPRVSLLDPVGPFTCSVPNNLTLQSEHLLNIPILFSPKEEKEEVQYVDITAGRTVCTLALFGEGISPNVRFIPDFVVCRLETPNGSFTEFNVDIENKSKAAIKINFVKTCELQGLIKEPEQIPNVDEKDKNKKKKDKKNKKDAKTTKIAKFSQELTKEEKYSVENLFELRGEQAKSFFDVRSKDELPEVNPNSKKSWKIRFGILPKIPEKESGKKGKGDKKTKEKQCSPAKSPGKDPIYYITKYNVILGESTVLKDIIVIAKFCK